MTDQPWLDGETEVLDPLIDLWTARAWLFTIEVWERRMAYAFMQAIRFYAPLAESRLPNFALNGWTVIWEARDSYEEGRLTRDTLKPALMNFDRFAKRVAEREVA